MIAYRRKDAKEAFSLIEIMIVIMIIGILAAVAMGGFAYLRRAKESATNTKLATIDVAIEQYNTSIGEYPTDLRELAEGPQKPALQRRWGESLVTEAELKDGWGQDFVYQLNPKGARPPYDLYSIGSTGTARIMSPRSKE
jgi:general secretion pathway protein G